MILKSMAIHYCSYSNQHHDPNPILFCMYSDSKYTEGLNIRYLSIAQRGAFFGMIRKLQGVGALKNRVGGVGPKVYNTFAYDGVMLYAIIKKYYYHFAQVAYRKYFSKYLKGVLVNDSLNAYSPLIDVYMKMQTMMGPRATNNYLMTRAKNDEVIRNVNTALWRTRVREMDTNENVYKPNMSRKPGPQEPQQEQREEQRTIGPQRTQQGPKSPGDVISERNE